MQNCPSCSNKQFIYHKEIAEFLLVRCAHCGLLITDITEENREKYVKENYSEKYSNDHKLALSKLNDRYIDHVSLLRKYNVKRRLLDIGCGTGSFLQFLKNMHKGWDLFGVEPSKILRKVASKNTELTIKDGKLSNIPFPDDYFDVVTCYDVLEHSVDLQKNIRELKRVLKPDGILFVQAPNYKSVMAYITGDKWDWWCIPDHVLHFSYRFLTDFLKRKGFTILKSYTYEDQVDFLSNIKGIFKGNYLLKAFFYLLIPIFIIIERVGWITDQGGLTVVIAKK